MTYCTRTFSVGALWFGVPFPKLQTFSGTFWVLPVDYSLYEKTILEIFVYLFICEFTMTKVNFRFYKQCSQAATQLFCERAIFAQNANRFLALIFHYKMKKIPWKNYLRFWKWNLKCTHQSAQNSFLRKSNLKFCIIFKMISFANAQGTVKVRLPCSKILLLINYLMVT